MAVQRQAPLRCVVEVPDGHSAVDAPEKDVH